MNPDLLSADVSLGLMAPVAAALVAHLSQIAGPHRLRHALYAATAAGLFYLFGGRALGWSFLPREALALAFGALFVFVATNAWRADEEEPEIAWGGLLVETGAMAYLFAPLSWWKPPVSALLLLYFLIELFTLLKGREEYAAGAGQDHRPPLFPPKRTRGLRELASAAAAAALVYEIGRASCRERVS
jgi:hypothetical protein